MKHPFRIDLESYEFREDTIIELEKELKEFEKENNIPHNEKFSFENNELIINYLIPLDWKERGKIKKYAIDLRSLLEGILSDNFQSTDEDSVKCTYYNPNPVITKYNQSY
jgi:hypothetical protein